MSLTFRLAARFGLRRYLRCRRGSSAVEFAIVFLPLLILLFGAVQLSLIFEIQAMLQNAADKAAREVLIGTPQTQHLTQSQFKDDVCLGLPFLISCDKLLVDVQVIAAPSFTPTAAPVPVTDGSGKVGNAGAYALGNPGDVVALRLLYVCPVVVLPGMNLANLSSNLRLLVATNVVKTEQYQ